MGSFFVFFFSFPEGNQRENRVPVVSEWVKKGLCSKYMR